MTLTEKLFGFKGRIGRGTYWLYVIALAIIGYLGESNFGSIMRSQNSLLAAVGSILDLLLLLIILWAELALSAKRWHDRGKSAWWILITLVPFIGGLWELVELGFLPGTDGPNEYGLDSN